MANAQNQLLLTAPGNCLIQCKMEIFGRMQDLRHIVWVFHPPEKRFPSQRCHKYTHLRYQSLMCLMVFSCSVFQWRQLYMNLLLFDLWQLSRNQRNRKPCGSVFSRSTQACSCKLRLAVVMWRLVILTAPTDDPGFICMQDLRTNVGMLYFLEKRDFPQRLCRFAHLRPIKPDVLDGLELSRLPMATFVQDNCFCPNFDNFLGIGETGIPAVRCSCKALSAILV